MLFKECSDDSQVAMLKDYEGRSISNKTRVTPPFRKSVDER